MLENINHCHESESQDKGNSSRVVGPVMMAKRRIPLTPFFEDVQRLPSLPSAKNRTSSIKFNDGLNSGRQTKGCQSELERERLLHSPENLNRRQREVFDFIQDPANKHSMVLIQAGPGRGKTFTMLTVAYANKLAKRPVHVFIYKRDLLNTFINCANAHTVCSVFMHLYDVLYYQCTALEKQVCGRMTQFEFAMVMWLLLSRTPAPMPANSLVIIDEYTVINKPMLFVLILWLKKYRIQTVICGDQYQLQAITDSKHTEISAYDIVSKFADARFELTTNKRCSDPEYNQMLDLFSEFACSRPLDPFGYAMVSAFFPSQLVASISKEEESNVVHLAYTHHELATTKFHLLLRHHWPVSFYSLEASVPKQQGRGKLHARTLCKSAAASSASNSQRYCPPAVLRYAKQVQAVSEAGKNPSTEVVLEQFLPFLPLIIKAKYFCYQYSERHIVTLEKVFMKENRVVVKTKEGEFRTLTLQPCRKVMFEKHAEFLAPTSGSEWWQKNNNNNTSQSLKRKKGHLGLKDDDDDEQEASQITQGYTILINYPLYPTFLMSVHMCQGRTIADQKLDVMLAKVCYHGLYVVLSRVKERSQIIRISLPDQVNHILTAIVNFPCIADGSPPTVPVVRNTMLTTVEGYRMYSVSTEQTFKELIQLLDKFFKSGSSEARHAIRNEIVLKILPRCQSQILTPPSVWKLRTRMKVSDSDSKLNEHSEEYAGDCLAALLNDNAIGSIMREVMLPIETVEVMEVLTDAHGVLLALATLNNPDDVQLWLHAFLNVVLRKKPFGAPSVDSSFATTDDGGGEKSRSKRAPPVENTLRGLLDFKKMEQIQKFGVSESLRRLSSIGEPKRSTTAATAAAAIPQLSWLQQQLLQGPEDSGSCSEFSESRWKTECIWLLNLLETAVLEAEQQRQALDAERQKIARSKAQSVVVSQRASPNQIMHNFLLKAKKEIAFEQKVVMVRGEPGSATNSLSSSAASSACWRADRDVNGKIGFPPKKTTKKEEVANVSKKRLVSPPITSRDFLRRWLNVSQERKRQKTTESNLIFNKTKH